MKKIITGLATAATIAAAVIAVPSASEARPWHHHGGWGGPGIVGGLAAGALIGGALAGPYYNGYYGYGPGPYAYGECYRRRVMTPYGWRWRRVCY